MLASVATAPRDSGLFEVEARASCFVGVPTSIISMVVNIALTILFAVPAIFSVTMRDYFKRRAYSVLFDLTCALSCFVGIFSPKASNECFGKIIRDMTTNFPLPSY